MENINTGCYVVIHRILHKSFTAIRPWFTPDANSLSVSCAKRK
jgi:hypothetical protein